MKNQKGITLIALIITIIVMLILVGVTINVALNGGLFEKAETATKETEEKAILEEMLAMMEIDNNGKFKPDEIIANMITKHPEYEIIYNKPNVTITGKLGEYKYIVSETEIKIGSKEIKTFEWEDVGLNVDIDTDYKFYDISDGTTYIINFKADGNLIVKKDGTIVATYDAKDDSNINDDGYLTVTFALNGTPFDTTLTMNTNNIDVDAELKGLTTITYKKILPKEYPIAYGDYDSIMVLQISPNENYLWVGTMGETIVNKAVKCTIQPCTDIAELPSYDSPYPAINQDNIKYSHALVGSDGSINAVWSLSEDKWEFVWKIESQYNNYIISGNILNRNANVTEDQMNSIIQSASSTNE